MALKKESGVSDDAYDERFHQKYSEPPNQSHKPREKQRKRPNNNQNNLPIHQTNRYSRENEANHNNDQDYEDRFGDAVVDQQYPTKQRP